MTKMPDAELAYVPEEKITAYLLEPAHPEGGDKAAFLISFGFRVTAPEELRDALLRHAREGTVAATRATPFGPQYAVEGPLRTPDARDPGFRTVWLRRVGEAGPRFVTSYPTKRR